MTTTKVYYGGPITVKYDDGKERTYNHATRPRQFYRALPEPLTGDVSAQVVNCHACTIDGQDKIAYCVGSYGGCPRALSEAK